MRGNDATEAPAGSDAAPPPRAPGVRRHVPPAHPDAPFDSDEPPQVSLDEEEAPLPRQFQAVQDPAPPPRAYQKIRKEAPPPIADDEEERPRFSFPGAPGAPPAPPPPRPRPEPPPEEALPLGAPVVHSVETDVQPKINPGQLPIWMASEGLNMLRQGDYEGAAEYYENEAKRDADRAEGWLGIGAALVGSGEYKKAVTYLLKGMEFDKSFPIGALLSEAKPGHPQVLFNLAELFLTVETPLSVQSAISILDECLASPTTPQKLYMKSDELRRKSREKLANLQIADKAGLLELQKKARKTRAASGAIRFLFTLVFLALLGAGGWFGYNFFQATRLYKQGMLDYSEAHHIAEVGSGSLNSSQNISDPLDLYYKAYTEFKQSSDFGPKDFHTWFMLTRSGEAILERARASSAVQKKLGPQTLGEIDKNVRLARTRMSKLDPSGSQLKVEQNELTHSLQQK
jgi:tetratricopeptide (TPR) repeat protein